MQHRPHSKAHTYRIAHSGSHGRLPREVEFEAADAAVALLETRMLAPPEQPILLKEDGRELGTVQLSLEGFWSVSRSIAQGERAEPALSDSEEVRASA